MIEENTPAPPPDLKELSEAELVQECERLLGQMERRLDAVEDADSALETGAAPFWPVRTLDEINSIGITFRIAWTELRIRTPDPPSEIRKRAEDIVDRFLMWGEKVVVDGEPGEPQRQRLRRLMGLSVYDT